MTIFFSVIIPVVWDGVGWKTQLKATLIKFMDETNSHHLLQDILVTGIHNWIHGLPFPTNQYPPDWQEYFLEANLLFRSVFLKTTSEFIYLGAFLY
jgi:hypothetical protein